MNRFITFSFLLLTVGAVFINSIRFTDSSILPKCLWAGFGVSLLLVCIAMWFLMKDRLPWDVRLPMIGTGIACAATGIYGILQYLGMVSSLSPYCRVTGSFDNPAGLAACLTAGLPFLFYGVHICEKIMAKGLLGALAILSLVAVCLSESRSGIASVLVMAVAVFFPYYKGWFKKRIWCFALLGLSLIVLSTVGYLMKKDSADGRLLIWKCALQMIADRPLTGHGLHAVEAKYMDYQARYLASYPNTSARQLADNVKHVFNEYLALGVCFGIVGWMALGGLVVVLLRCLRKRPSAEGRTGLLSLLGIGVFAAFSYPFAYPCIWVIALFDVYLILRPLLSIVFLRNVWFKVVSSVFCLSSACLLCILTVQRTMAELKWGMAAQASANGDPNALTVYRKLYPDLYRNPYFLYNYAAELHAARQYRRSQTVALHCAHYWSDYDLEILLGENLYKLQLYQEAEPHFIQACLMCPSRFVPFYGLYRLYQQQGLTEKSRRIGEYILHKPVKIDSDVTRAIRSEVRRDLEKIRANSMPRWSGMER